MRKIKWLILGALVLSLGVTQPVFAETPSGCNSNGVGIGITPFVLGSPTVGPVAEGDVITYRVTLSVPPSSGSILYCNFSGGQLSVTLPDGTNVQTAGFGGATPNVPVVSEGVPFAVDCPTDYVVTAADVASGSITAYADYGSTARYPTQINGTFDDPSQQQTASATTSNALSVECPEPCVEITKDVNCSISKVGDEVTYTICILNCGDSNLIDVVVTDDILTIEGFPSVLAPGDPCCIDFPYEIQESDAPGPVVNQAHVEAVDECDGETPVSEDSDEVTVVLVDPDFIATKDCRDEPLQVDDVAIFDVYFENTGNVCLRFDVCDIDPCSFDLAPGESMGWETHITVESEEDVLNTLTGTAILLPGDPLTTCGDPCACLDNVLDVEASDECDVSVGATRTPGFWKTHYYLTEHVLETHCMDDVNLGWVDANDIDVMMAIFWEKKAKQSKLCQARIQGSFHAMAAMLNNCHPDGLSLADYMSDNCSAFSPDDIPVILGGCDIDAIKELASCLGEYNEAGDDVEITFPAGLEAYNAQPGYAREQAEGLFPQTECDYDCDNGVQAVTSQGKGKGKGKNK